MATKYIEVVLKSEWLGNPKGSKLTLNEVTANSLIARGSAKVLEKKDDKGAKAKDVPFAPKDKMMRTVRKKRV